MLTESPVLLDSTRTKSRLWVLVFAICITVIALIKILLPIYFSSWSAINLSRQIAVPGIIASGMAVVVIGGGFDLSVGATAALSGILAVGLAPHGRLESFLLPLAVGGLCGFINGLLVWYAAIHPLIITLGMRYLIYSAATIYTHGFIQVNREPSFLMLGRSSCFGLPVPALLFFVVAIGLQGLLRRTVMGNALYAIGNNERAAFYSGVSTQWFRVASYVISGLCAAMGGLLLASRSGAAAPDAGQGYELEAIAAVAVGGLSLLGGSGSLWNVLIGVLLFALINNILVVARQPYEVHQIVAGLMIITSLAFDSYFRKKRPR